jgi:uncharacterized protein (DUF58 family)
MAVATGLALTTVVAWAATTLAARRVTVTRTLPVREAREYEPIRVHFDVTGLGRLPVTLEARNGEGAWTPLGGSLELVLPRRGAHRLAPSELRVRDPLGIAHRHITAGRPEALLILPAPDERLLRAAPSGPAAGDPEPDGLQAYAPGIPIARIHWPALARGAGLHARRVAAGPHELPLVVVDTSGAPQPGAVDWAARTAAGHVLRLARNGGCRVRLPGDRRDTTVADPAAWRALHRRLALLAPGPAAAAPPMGIRIAAAAATSLPEPPPLPYGVEPSSPPPADGRGGGVDRAGVRLAGSAAGTPGWRGRFARARPRPTAARPGPWRWPGGRRRRRGSGSAA